MGRTSRRAAPAPQHLPAGRHAALPDERLVALAVAGDRDAFGTLVVRHQRAVVNYIHRLTGLTDGAADLAQEVFIKVFVSLASFDPRYRFTTWLYRIASNCAIDHLRHRQLRTCAFEGECEDDPPPADPAVAGHEPDPLTVLRLREVEDRLDRAVAALPPAYRQLILLRHRQHCRYDEIARITRLPIGTVKNRIFRAREILKARLADVLDKGALT